MRDYILGLILGFLIGVFCGMVVNVLLSRRRYMRLDPWTRRNIHNMIMESEARRDDGTSA